MNNEMRIFFILHFTFLSIVYSQIVDVEKFYYRDYLDFGQNKGIFKPNAKNLTLVGKDNKPYNPFADIPFPDFSARTIHGSSTSLGLNHAVTAFHVTALDPGVTGPLQREDTKFGQTSYKNLSVSKVTGIDNKFVRFNKYIVEGNMDLIQTGITNHTQSPNNPNTEIEQENINKLQMALKDFKANDKNNIYAYQAGSGRLAFMAGELPYDSNNPIFIENQNMRGGGDGRILSYAYSVWQNNSRGIVFVRASNMPFNNRTSQGDSGSSIYAFNEKENKWYLLGVASYSFVGRNNSQFSFVDKKEYEDYKKQFEKTIDLQNKKHELNNTNLSDTTNGNNNQTLTQNRDIIFTNGGEIEVNSNILRMTSGQTGGFIFKGGTQDNVKTYTIKTKSRRGDLAGNVFGFDGSGLYIEEHAKVIWDLKNVKTEQTDALHKIGKGTLELQNQYEPKGKEKLGYFRVGEGKVIFNTDKKAYDGVYVTSGRATLELEKLEGIGATNINNKYKLSQDNKNMEIYFGNGGGNLDLKGKSLTVNMIAANDYKANIINTDNANKADFTFEGYKYNQNATKDTTKIDYIYHGSMGMDATNNNMNLIQKETTKGSHNLIFDGFIDIKGKLDSENSNITLQGHPTIHASIRNKDLLDQVKKFENKALEKRPWMDLSRPSTLEQPDWDDRSFKFGEGITLNNSNLNIGRNATLVSNIDDKNGSTINFGGNMKHFIDKFDGNNVTGNGFSFSQEVENANLANNQANDTISYKGKITGNNTTINSRAIDFQANLDLKGSSKLTAEYLTISSSSNLKLADSSNATIDNLILDNINAKFDNKITLVGNNTKFEVKKGFSFKNSNFNLDNITNNGTNSKPTLPTNYDIFAYNNSTVTGNNKDLIGNVYVDEKSNVTLKSLTLKNLTEQNSILTKSDTNSIKNTILVQNKDSNVNAMSKLSLTGELKAENLDSTNIYLNNKGELSTNGFTSKNVKETFISVRNNSKFISNENINHSGKSKLNLLISDNSTLEVKNKNIMISDVGKESFKDKSFLQDAGDNDKLYSSNLLIDKNSKITANELTISSSLLNLKLSDKSNLELSGKLEFINSGMDSNDLNSPNFPNLLIDKESKITAKNLNINNSSLNLILNNQSSLTLNEDINVTSTNKSSNSSIISLQDATISANILKLNNTSLTINDTNSQEKGLKISKLDINNSNININSNKEYNFNIDSNMGMGTTNISINNFKLDNKNINAINAMIKFNKLTYDLTSMKPIARIAAAAPVTKEIKGNISIQEELQLQNVGAKTNDVNNDNRFYALKLGDTNTLTLGNASKINVDLHSDVEKNDSTLTLGKYYTIFSASSIIDNRNDKRTNFNFQDKNNALFVTSKIEDNKLKVKFTQDDPKSLNELQKHVINDKVLSLILEHNPNDIVIDTAVKTDNYELLDKYINKINENMEDIANNNVIVVNNKVLITNNDVINNRINQVKNLRRASNYSPIYLASTSKLVSLRLIQQVNNKTLNNVWLNAGGGYYKSKDNDLIFYGTNLGYDRTFNLNNSVLLFGIMAGYGQSRLNATSININSTYYNAGLYLDIDAKNNEFQSNLNSFYGINDRAASVNLADGFNSYDKINSNSISILWSNYYKYNFNVGNTKNIYNYIKPILLADVQLDILSGYQGKIYKQQSVNNLGLDLGGGIEYTIINNNNMYSISIITKYNIYNSLNYLLLSLSNANNFISYKIDNRPLSFQPNFSGYIQFPNNISLNYGLSALLDIKGGIGGKGDIKIEYRF